MDTKDLEKEILEMLRLISYQLKEISHDQQDIKRQIEILQIELFNQTNDSLLIN